MKSDKGRGSRGALSYKVTFTLDDMLALKGLKGLKGAAIFDLIRPVIERHSL